MTKPKTIDQLRAEKERAETQLAQEQHKLERLENRKKAQVSPYRVKAFGWCKPPQDAWQSRSCPRRGCPV